MGVHATFCQICGLPVQHDHYVATERENFWKIYRQDNRPDGHFDFGPEHDWLLRGVAVIDDRDPVFGTCCDGALVQTNGDPEEEEGCWVGDGFDEYMAFHQYCWETAGKPGRCEQVLHHKRNSEWILLGKYQQQLFDFGALVQDGLGWMLLDPTSPEGQQSKARIARILLETP